MTEVVERARKIEEKYRGDQGVGRVWNLIGEGASVRRVVAQKSGWIGEGEVVIVSSDGEERKVWGGIFLERADTGHNVSRTVFRSEDGEEEIELQRAEF